MSANANPPTRDGFAGAGRSGIVREAIFTNPAALALLQGSFAFGYYTKSRLVSQDSGGRDLTVGIYDGDNEYAKAGVSYERESRASISELGVRYYDRTIYRLGLGKMLTSSVGGGLTGKYIVRRQSLDESKKFDADAGIFLPVFTDIIAGITYENFLNVEEENPTMLGIGLKYSLAQSIGLLADASRVMKGSGTGRRSWSAAVEVSLAGDFYIRGGLYKDEVNKVRGKALGASWSGPRASFDYALKMATTEPKEKSHSFGITLQL